MQDLINIGMKGINASYKSLSVTGTNINNIDTPHYSRQQAMWQNSATGGVDISEVRRIYAGYNADSLQNSASDVGKWNAYLTAANGLDNLLGTIDNGLNSAIGDFFNNINQVGQNAGDITARDLVLNSAQNLAAKFNELHTQLNDEQQSLQTELTTKTAQANSLIKRIAELNHEIGQNPTNESLDAREQAIEDLSQLIAINVTRSGNNCSVYTKAGPALVTDDNTHLLNFADNKLSCGTQKLPLVNVGGALGGLFDAQKQMLETTQANLGKLALKISHEINQQLAQGIDLNGNLGSNLFKDLTNYNLEDAAREFAIIMNDPKALALANPLTICGNSKAQITANINSLNKDITKQLPLTIKILENNQYQILNSNNKVIKQDNIKNNKISLNDEIIFNIKGELQVNDVFNVSLTTNNSNDNSNALKLADLKNSINDASNNISNNIGVKINNAHNQLKTSNNNLNKFIEFREIISGVNLDEEQANLLKFQQYYDANAQIIKTAQTTFNTLLNVI